MPKDMLAGFIYYYLDEKEKARLCFEKSIPLLRASVKDYPDDPRYHSSLGIALARTGRKEEAIREGKQAVALLPLSKDQAYGTSYVLDLSVIYSIVGEVDAALEQIEVLMKMSCWYSPKWIRMDIRYATLHKDPKFESLLEKYRKKYELE